MRIYSDVTRSRLETSRFIRSFFNNLESTCSSRKREELKRTSNSTRNDRNLCSDFSNNLESTCFSRERKELERRAEETEKHSCARGKALTLSQFHRKRYRRVIGSNSERYLPSCEQSRNPFSAQQYTVLSVKTSFAYRSPSPQTSVENIESLLPRFSFSKPLRYVTILIPAIALSARENPAPRTSTGNAAASSASKLFER